MQVDSPASTILSTSQAGGSRPEDPQVLGWMCMKAATDRNDIARLPGGNASRSARKLVSLDFVTRGGAQSSTQGLSI